tara:strand:+ start:80 stop:304 length:225 start_codon:yes stop_codon:yes gene_type:complete
MTNNNNNNNNNPFVTSKYNSKYTTKTTTTTPPPVSHEWLCDEAMGWSKSEFDLEHGFNYLAHLNSRDTGEDYFK